MRRVVWKMAAWLFLKRWGAIPKMVVCGSLSVSPAPRHDLWRRTHYIKSSARSVALRICSVRSFRYEQMGVESELVNMQWGIREVYRDLAHIIHERFCYNRRSLTQARRARLAGKARQARHEVRSSGFEVPKTSNFGPRTVIRPAFLASLAPRVSRAHCAISRRTVRSKED